MSMKRHNKKENDNQANTVRSGKRMAVVCLFLATLFSLAAVADTPMPEIPKGKGDKCMDDTDVMRKSHMDKLLHKRDRTMYQGIRTEQFSLKQCISCHVVVGQDQKPVSAASPKHFCRVCHDYASVKIDCFECHASKPRPQAAALSVPAMPAAPTRSDETSNNTSATGGSL
ncbi:MAG: hypothetical protein OEZ68_13385 [Gammaproteobacteria bacterium]|nr:hypothetical protein [Gammaproteobacteria bacterium]